MLLSSILSVLIASSVAVFNYNGDDITPDLLETGDGQSVLNISNGFCGTLPGLPDIPLIPEWIPLQAGERAVSISVKECVWEDAGEGVFIRPLPLPCILSGSPGDQVTVPSDVFLQDTFWPSEPVVLSGTGLFRGAPHAELVVSPFRYNPVSGDLQRLVSFTAEVATEPWDYPIRYFDDGESERMLIITDQSIRVPFDSLAAWRTAQGIFTEVVTTDQVSSMPGSDECEKIRNYIISYRENWGLDHVLLGGDTNFIPCRFAFPMSYQWSGGREDHMPCDLYFSDLDGDWNLDGDTVWGEVADSVDLYPDVHIGRAPCENLEEAWTFWNKIKTYETMTGLGHLDETLLAAGVLWEEPFTDDADVKKYIRDHHIPEWFTNTELYTTSGNYTTSSVMASLNQGTGYVNLNDHGWIHLVGCLTSSNVDQIDSDGRFFGMMYSVGCWTNAFDSDCVAEHFLNNSQGCGVSYIGNSSYGWGSPGNPLFGYSDRFDRELFKILFEQPSLSLGELVSAAKETYIPFAGQENCYRCVLYMVNLLGDPSMRTFRRNPITPVVETVDFVTQYTSSIPVVIQVPGDYTPEEITFCIHDSDFTNYQVVEPDASGYALMDLDSPPQGDLTLTVTGTDLNRISISIPQATGPLPVVTDIAVSNPEGYTHPAPGTVSQVALSLGNQGSELLTSLSLTATLQGGPGVLAQGYAGFPDLSPGTEGQGDQALVIEVDEDAQTGQVLSLAVQIDSDQGTWNTTLPLLVYAPGLYFTSYTVDDAAGGNSNGYPEPGETFNLTVGLANTGLLIAENLVAVISSDESWLSWTTDTCYAVQLLPDNTAQLDFTGVVSPSAPDTAYPVITLSTQADPLWEAAEEFMMVIGEFCISEDFENGPGQWTHSGESDMWHLSNADAHSGEWSWWCGDEESMSYQDNMMCSLYSPNMFLAPQAELTFWSSFNVDLYGGDGLYVIISNLDSSISDTLDFVGAGGLLSLETLLADGNMLWLPRTYDLSDYPAGTRVQVEFGFFSDAAEGNQGAFRIDDVHIDGYMDLTGAQEPDYPMIIGLPHPNPSSGAFSIPLYAQDELWTLTVHDLAGRLIYTAGGDEPWAGDFSLQLQRVPTGVYLITARTSEGAMSRKVVITGSR